MAVRYQGGGFVKPPRAEIAQDASFLPHREAHGMWAQIKKNGTHTVISVDPDRNIVAWDRRGAIQRAWRFNANTSEIFRALPGRDWYVFDGELLHNKTPHIKNQIYLYDILVCQGIHLTGTHYEFRYQVLFDTLAQGQEFGRPQQDTQYFRLHDHVSIARNYKHGFDNLFKSLNAPEDEGLVLRRPDGIYTTAKADSWMVKFRRKEITKLY